MMKTRTKYFLCLLIGFAAGGILSLVYFRALCFKVLKSEIINEIWALHRTAEDAYYDEPNEAAVSALNYSITTLKRIRQDIAERYYESFDFIAETNSYCYSMLALEHAMIGNLYKKLGDTEKSKYYFVRAISLSSYIKSDLPSNLKTEEDCIKWLDSVYAWRKQFSQGFICGYGLQTESDFNDYIRDFNKY